MPVAVGALETAVELTVADGETGIFHSSHEAAHRLVATAGTGQIDR